MQFASATAAGTQVLLRALPVRAGVEAVLHLREPRGPGVLPGRSRAEQGERGRRVLRTQNLPKGNRNTR